MWGGGGKKVSAQWQGQTVAMARHPAAKCVLSEGQGTNFTVAIEDTAITRSSLNLRKWREYSPLCSRCMGDMLKTGPMSSAHHLSSSDG